MKCYYCENEGTTVEHIPPKCIFPENKRKNLITVKSCYTHNNEKSGDDEYLRNILTICKSINVEGEKHFSNKTLKSIIRNQNGNNNIIKNPELILVNNEESISNEINYERITTLLSLMSSAFYFYTYHEQYRNKWLVSIGDVIEDDDSFLFQLFSKIKKIDSSENSMFKEQSVENSDIFRYFTFRESGLVVFKYIFYGSVEIYCISNSLIDTELKFV